MSHRFGHVDGSGDGNQSMDRRKYLGMLAAGAAFGTVAAGMAACGGSSTTEKDTTTTDPTHEHQGATAATGTCDIVKQWGTLSLYPPNITTMAAAQSFDLATLPGTIKVPFFNSNGISLQEGMQVGFSLIRIGCPVKFVIAANLIIDETAHQDIPGLDIVQRNRKMDEWLTNNGYPETAWSKPDGKPCPDLPPTWE